jgi:2-polyprenyl-3-methyl-5-hydroxy-6-metoxy-1,4-benzoquinol methylase
VTCPICRSGKARELYRFEPARWIPGSVVRCQSCGTIYKRLSPAAKPLAAYYDEGYAALEYWDDESATRRALDPIVAAVRRGAPSGARLLDVGSGAGAFLQRAVEAGFRATGLELNPALAERARRTGAEIIVGDIESGGVSGRRFDVITLLDLIEHLLDPVAALRRCHELLAPGGRIVLYTPNHASLIVRVADLAYRLTGGRVGGPVAEIFDCLHTVFFDPGSLRRAVDAAGLRAVETTLLPYDPERSRMARGVAALALRSLEAVSPLAGGRFRLLLVAAAAPQGEAGRG